METATDVRQDTSKTQVAILLATYNGARFVAEQIRSLSQNAVPFTLHWVDDHSTDNTVELVRKVASEQNISLQEWHHSERLGVPGTFFHLLDCVNSDIYLFCDQDDLWQPGKIDATVQNLLPDLALPVLCFTDPIVFKSERPEERYRMLDILGTTAEVAIEDSRAFMTVVGYGHTEGFTRPLRDLYRKHHDVAKSHAFMHDMWVYDIAVATGGIRILKDAPTTLYRWHEHNSSGDYGGWRGHGKGYFSITWKQHQTLRRAVARHARGFIRAASTIPPSSKLDRLLAIAALVSALDRRQSPATLLKLVRHRTFWPTFRLSSRLAAACLCSDATA